MNKKNHLTIKALDPADRPREKLVQLGTPVLSSAELLAILIGSGSRTESAVLLCQRILSDVNGDLNALAKKSLQELQKYKGIGEAKAVTIKAALALAKRRRDINEEIPAQIRSSKDAFLLLRNKVLDIVHEEFWLVLLKRDNRVLSTRCIGKGGVAAVYADPKIIFKEALDHLATGLILAHNHPSGALQPSKQDIALTLRIGEVARFLEINLFDHLIIAGDAYYSFADEGKLS